MLSIIYDCKNKLYSWGGALLIDSIPASDDNNFAAIIRYEIHERAFRETTTLPFHCFVQ